FSCTGLVSEEQFLDMLRRAAVYAGRTVQVLKVAGAGADHPFLAHVPESRYLKAVFCRVRECTSGPGARGGARGDDIVRARGGGAAGSARSAPPARRCGSCPDRLATVSIVTVTIRSCRAGRAGVSFTTRRQSETLPCECPCW